MFCYWTKKKADQPQDCSVPITIVSPNEKVPGHMPSRQDTLRASQSLRSSKKSMLSRSSTKASSRSHPETKASPPTDGTPQGIPGMPNGMLVGLKASYERKMTEES